MKHIYYYVFCIKILLTDADLQNKSMFIESKIILLNIKEWTHTPSRDPHTWNTAHFEANDMI